MATITLRASKGSPLTNTEVDNNFTNLNNDKYESGDNIAAADLSVTGDVTLGTANVTAAGNTQGTAQAITKTYNICMSHMSRMREANRNTSSRPLVSPK